MMPDSEETSQPLDPFPGHCDKNFSVTIAFLFYIYIVLFIVAQDGQCCEEQVPRLLPRQSQCPARVPHLPACFRHKD
jgi:hypothetical protein